MVEWNPVQGLKKIEYKDLKVGDDVVIQAYIGDGYRRTTVKDVKLLSNTATYYLLSREIHEPEGRGDLADIYFTDSGEVVQTLIRTRPKYKDDIGGDYISPWTDDSNNTVMDWPSIMNKVTENEEYSLRTYTATYTEN